MNWKNASACIAGIMIATVSFAHEEDADPVQLLQKIGDVGDVSFSISCKGQELQDQFSRAVALLHHMTYEVAEKEFSAVAKQDPACAMAHWGIAMTLIHPVWPGRPEEKILRRGAAQIALARSLAKSEREAHFVEALAAFYDDWESVDHALRIQRWDKAQTSVRNRYPKDDEAQAFYAVVHIAAAAKDDLEYRFNREAGILMEGLFARRPRHPAGIHYLIHAYDNPLLAVKALAAARAYDEIAPEVPHALHMPTHIFTRLGLWMDSAHWNIRSREAARNLLLDGAVYGEFAHASDYLVYAYLQAGHDAQAADAKSELFKVDRHEDHFKVAYAFAAVPARIELELGNWQAAAKLEPRFPDNIAWDKYPATEALTHFAIGLGAARTGHLEKAREANSRLGQIIRALEAKQSTYWGRQVGVQKTTVEAWIAHAEGHTEEALEAMGKAAAAEDALDKNPVTPGAILPARELYADMFASGGKWQAALKAYTDTLRISPNRFQSLAGAGWAAEQLGNDTEARIRYKRLLEIAKAGATSRLGLERARSFLGVVALNR